MPRTKKTTDVKATDKKTVKAAPAEEVKFAELVVEPDKKTESKTEAKNEAVVAPAKAETKDTPKKLYTATLHEFGTKRGLEIYRLIKKSA